MIGKLWTGGHGLIRTFWMFGVVGFTVMNIVGVMFVAAADSKVITEVPSIGLIVIYAHIMALSIAYVVIVTVGVVRSLKTYEGNLVWGVLAVLYLVGSWAVLLIDLLIVAVFSAD